MSNPMVAQQRVSATFNGADLGYPQEVKPITSQRKLNTYDRRTPGGKALALVHELREEKKISSADFAVLLAVLQPIAYAECAALDGTKSA